MEVAHGRKKLGHFAKALVDLKLFEVSLSEAFLICFILLVGSIKNLFAFPYHDFLFDKRTSVVILAETELILPGAWHFLRSDRDMNRDIGISAGGQAPQLGHTTPMDLNAPHETTTFGGNVMQKPKYIQKIRFSRGVWADEEDTALKVNLHMGKILPVFQTDMGEPKSLTWLLAHFLISLFPTMDALILSSRFLF